MSLTNNFTLAELTHSDTAKARGIDNSLPPYLMRNIQALVERLQLIRDALGVPITISSGYRCPELNRAVQELSARVQEQQAMIEVQQATADRQDADIAELRAMLQGG